MEPTPSGPNTFLNSPLDNNVLPAIIRMKRKRSATETLDTCVLLKSKRKRGDHNVLVSIKPIDKQNYLSDSLKGAHIFDYDESRKNLVYTGRVYPEPFFGDEDMEVDGEMNEHGVLQPKESEITVNGTPLLVVNGVDEVVQYYHSEQPLENANDVCDFPNNGSAGESSDEEVDCEDSNAEDYYANDYPDDSSSESRYSEASFVFELSDEL